MEDDKKQEELENKLEENQDTNNKEGQEKKEGSGIFDADGNELPKIDGGYSIHGPGGTLGDNRLK